MRLTSPEVGRVLALWARRNRWRAPVVRLRALSARTTVALTRPRSKPRGERTGPGTRAGTRGARPPVPRAVRALGADSLVARKPALRGRPCLVRGARRERARTDALAVHSPF